MEAYTVSSLIIVGIINQIKKQIALNTLIGFGLALVLGTLFGFLHWFGLTSLEMGFIAGMISSGAYTIAKKFGGQ